MKKSDSFAGYDVIGDIHGHGDELLALLQKLGYSHDGISYRHDSRQALFLGDFVDRGPKQRLFEGTPGPEATNVACLDYSVPRVTGKN